MLAVNIYNIGQYYMVDIILGTLKPDTISMIYMGINLYWNLEGACCLSLHCVCMK